MGPPGRRPPRAVACVFFSPARDRLRQSPHGWTPFFLTLHRGAQLAGAVPLYLKTHSRGEYVFDHAWADAFERHGLRYYPKLLAAVPFTPVAARACWPPMARPAAILPVGWSNWPRH